INSGYKAIKCLGLIYLLPLALLYHVLPEKYWRNFCFFVCAEFDLSASMASLQNRLPSVTKSLLNRN
ncbi:hypothetical protein CONPUDRAFT_52806, partial [Coniophora puteana RWD-64-598 SS2]